MAEAVLAEDSRPAKTGRAGLFWRYWIAATISNAGDAVTTVALPLAAVVTLRASSFDVSLLTAARYLAWIVIGLPAGVLVHRLPLRGMQVAMDLIRAVAVLSVPVAAALGVMRLAQLVCVALVIGLASVMFDVGNSTFLTSIVGKEELTAKNSLTSGSVAVTQLGGPSLGGVLVQAFGAAASLLFDAVSYVISASLLQSLPRPAHREPARRDASTAALIKEGWRYVTRHEVIGPCVAVATLTNFVCGGLMALTPVFLVRTLGASPSLVGVLIATEGLGSLIGAAATPRLASRLGSARALRYASLAGALAAILMPLSGPRAGLLLFAVGSTGFAAGVVVLSILTRTHRQTVTPPELLPRVMATVRFISWGAIPFGSLTAGILATWTGNRGAFLIICAFTLLAPLVYWVSPIRRRHDLT